MENEKMTTYENALNAFIEARKELAAASVAYDTERHSARKALYDLKGSGVRKMTEEQIRSEATVTCKETYERYYKALAESEIARERLEFVKAIINN